MLSVNNLNFFYVILQTYISFALYASSNKLYICYVHYTGIWDCEYYKIFNITGLQVSFWRKFTIFAHEARLYIIRESFDSTPPPLLMNWFLQTENHIYKRSLYFKMKLKIQTRDSLTGPSKGSGTRVTGKVCRPLFFLKSKFGSFNLRITRWPGILFQIENMDCMSLHLVIKLQITLHEF